MKKIMGVLVGVFCLAAILLVAFFGTLPFTKESNIYCDYIVMNMAKEVRDNDGNIVYETKSRPDEKDIKRDDEWFDNDYSYRIQITDLKYVFDNLDGKLNLRCKAMTNKTGKVVTDDKLNFYCIEPSDTYTSYLDFNEDNKNIIEFKPGTLSKYTSMKAFTFKVQSNDAHKKYIHIRMQIKAQNNTTNEVNL